MTKFTRDLALNTMNGSNAFTPNRNLKRLSNALFPLLFLCVLFFGSNVQAQQMSNYAFTTATNASLEDLDGNGETILLGPDFFNSGSSDVTAIGFPFYFMGSAYSYFSVGVNGGFMLHKLPTETKIATTSITPGANLARLSAFGGDNSSKALKYKVIGTAPNRILVIEWTGFGILNTELDNSGNMQAWLHEATGKIDYVYGEIYNSSSSSQSRTIYLSSSNTTSTIGSINIQTPPTEPTFVTGTTTLFSNSLAAGSGTSTGSPLIANIGSSADGSRRIFSFNPGTYTGQATNLTFTGVNALGMTLNWTDAATDESGFLVDISTDGGATWTNLTTTAPNVTSYVVNGLTESTPYSWRVAAIREVPGAFVSANQATSAPGNITSIASGNWSNTATWSSGTIPTNADNVTISDGHTVVQDVTAAAAYSLTIGSGAGAAAILEHNNIATARTLTVGNDVTINGNGTLRASAVSPASSTTHTISINGNMTINGAGVFTGSTFANSKLNITFTGATNNTFTTSASSDVNFNTLTVNKGASYDNILEFIPGANFTAPTTGFATLTNGTLKLSGSGVVVGGNPVHTISTSSIGATAGFWLNNANFEVTAKAASPTMSGLLRITAGTYNAGTTNAHILGGAATSKFIIEGGTLNVSARFYVTSSSAEFNMSGGVINVATVGNTTSSSASFGFSSTTSVFTMSGGDIYIINPSTGTTKYDVYINTTDPTITGGTVHFGGTGTPPATVFNGLRGKTPNLVIGSGHTVNAQAAPTILGNLTVENGAIFNYGTFNVIINGNPVNPGNVINNGTITHAVSTTVRLQFFGAHGQQTYSGTGEFGNATQPIAGIGVSNPAGVHFATTGFVTNRINLFEGPVTGAGNITFGNGGSGSTTIQISQGGSTVMGGSLDAAPVWNTGTGGHTVLYLQEPSSRNTGFEIPTSRLLNNLSIDNTSGITLTGGAVGANSITLTNGNITTSAANLLTFAGTANPGSATSYINGPVARVIPASQAGTNTFTLPTGKTTYYPFDVVNPTTTAGGTVTVQAEVFETDAGGTPGAFLGSLSTNRYWAASITDGAANFTSSFVRLNAPRNDRDEIANSLTLNGTYEIVGGLTPVLDANSITSVAPEVTTIDGYYLMASAQSAQITNILATPAGDACTNVARTITATIIPGASPVASAEILYSVNGVDQTPILMTNTAGNDWSGVIPTITPANATVVWSIRATGTSGLVNTEAGGTYADEPLTHLVINTGAQPTTVCMGETTTLSVNVPGEITIGEGEETDASYVSPFYGLYPNKHQQIMIRASELQAAQMSAGQLSALSFYINAVDGTDSNHEFSLKLANTNATDMTTFVTTGFTEVYSTAVYTPVVGENRIDFTSPFTWDGVSNIVVEICFGDPTTSSPIISSTAVTDVTSFVSVIKTHTSSVISGALQCDNTTTNLVTYSERPQITFHSDQMPQFTINWSDGANTVGTEDTIVVVPTNNNTTYTATLTNINNGCTKSSSVNVTALDLPAQPIGGGSTQCGEGVPGAFVVSDFTPPSANNDGFRWYDAPTGGNLIQTGGATFLGSISTTTVFYVSEFNGSCESVRTAVTATVTQPDAVTANASALEVCLGAPVDLSVTQTGSNQTYAYTWTATPETGSGITGSSPGAPGTGALQVTPTAAGTYLYQVAAYDAGSDCATSSTVSVIVNKLPFFNTISATPSVVCAGEPVTLTTATADGDPGDVTIGAGDITDASYLSPFYSAWSNKHEQILYRASELQAAGLLSGNLTSITFYTTSVDATDFNHDFSIKLGTTADTAMTAFAAGPFTEVYSNSLFQQVLGANTITFSTPFYWDGVSNIVVDICFGTTTTTNVLSSTTETDATSYVSVIKTHIGAATSAAVACADTITNKLTYSERPQTTFAGNVGTGNSATMNFVWNPGNLSGQTQVVTPSSTQVYTVTATSTVTGCVNTAQVTANVNPVPPAPTANNGSHCGDLMPFASVSSNSGAPAPIYNWYDAATGGTLLQSGTDASFMQTVSVTTTWWVSETSPEGCEGPRVAVTEDVIEADAVTASADDIEICLGESVNLDVTQNGSTNFYDYSWSANPEAGSGLVNPTPGQQQMVTPTATGVYEYQVTAEDFFAGCFATSTVQVTVNALPVITHAGALESTVCSGTPTTLAAASIPASAGTATFGTGTSSSITYGPLRAGIANSKFQYLFTADELQAMGMVQGPITSLGVTVTTTSGTLGPLTGFNISIGTTTEIETSTTFIPSTNFTTVYDFDYTPVTGTNTIVFTTPYNWDGTSNIVVQICHGTISPLGTSASVEYTNTGSNKTTYSTATTGCSTLTGTASPNRPNITFGAQLGEVLTGNYSWAWNPGNVSGDTVIVSPTVTTTYEVTATSIVTGCASLPTQVEVTVLPLPATPVASPSTQCGEGIPAASVTGTGGTLLWYDAPTGGNVVQSGGTTFSGSINTTTTWYIAESDGTCESERVALTATVNQPDAVTAQLSEANICPGETTVLSVVQNGTTQNYVYTWSATPETGSGLVNGTTGASINLTPTATGTFVYDVVAFDASGPCTVSSTVQLVVNPKPVITSLTATPEVICAGGSSELKAESLSFAPGTATFGTGTLSSTTYGPFRAGNAVSKFQYLFTADELTAAGLAAGPITSMTLNVTTASGTFGPLTNFNVLMGTTSITATTSTFQDASGFTLVYDYDYTPVTGSNTLVFSTPFIWDGTSNIIIQTCHGTQSPTGTSASVNYYSLGTGNARTTYSTTTGCTQTSGTSSVNRPIITFGGTLVTDNSGIYDWSWTPGSLAGRLVTVNPVTTTTYTALATNPTTLCVSDPMTVEVTVTPVGASAQADNMTSCSGLPVNLTSNPTGGAPFAFSWSDGTTVVGTTENLTVNPTTTTTYTVTVTDVCGNNIQSGVTVTVNPVPNASIVEAGPIALCSPATQTLTASTTTANPQYQWQLNGVDIPSANASTYVVTDATSGVYTVRVTESSTNCSTTSASVRVDINPLPGAIVMDPVAPTICEGSNVVLNASSGTAPFTIGTGTSTSSTVTPFKGFWGGSRMQLLYTEAELTAAGATAGSPISSLGMYVNTFTGPYTFKNFTVKMGHTSITALTSTFETGLNTVLGPVNYALSGTPPFTETVNLSSPFVWDGSSNVVIEFCFWNEGLVGVSANSAAVRYTSKTGGALYRSNDTDAGVCSSTATGTTSSLRTNITFGFANYGAITWSPATGLSATSGGTVTANPTETTTYTATATTVYGCTVTEDVTVTVSPALEVSAEITGPTNPGAHVGSGSPVATYTITADNYSTITWAVPAGATNVSGQGTTSLSFNYPVGYTTGTVSVTVDGIAPCGSITRTLNIACDAPAAPVVSGPKNVCTYIGDGAEATYTIAPDATVSTYNWILPPGVNVVSGLGTGILTVTFDNTFGVAGSKQLRVTATNGCGTSALSIYYLVADKPASLGNITGPNDACGYVGTANQATYSVAAVDQAESYSWTLPAGVNLVGGAGTNSITVTFDNSFATSAITVNALNSCGTSNTRSITVTRTLPSTPAQITGSTNVCLYMPTSSNPSGVEATYSVPRVGVNTYNWTVPAEATITSQTQTATHDVITVSYSAAFTGGTISVTATNNCGTSPVARTLTLNRLNPGTPSAIDVVNTSSCPTRTYTYSLSAMPANTTSVEWTVPAGGTILSGAGTHIISVEYSGIAIAGDVTATAINGCGTSGTRKVAVKLPACPPAPKAPELPITGTQPTKHTTKDQPQTELSVDQLEVTVFPNPSTHAFKLIARSEDKVSKLQVRLLDNLGREHKRFVMMPGETLTLGAELKAGAYFVEVLQGKAKVTKRILKY